MFERVVEIRLGGDNSFDAWVRGEWVREASFPTSTMRSAVRRACCVSTFPPPAGLVSRSIVADGGVHGCPPFGTPLRPFTSPDGPLGPADEQVRRLLRQRRDPGDRRPRCDLGGKRR